MFPTELKIMRDRYENKESDIQDINKILMVYREESQRLNQVIKENDNNYHTMLELEWVDRVIKSHEMFKLTLTFVLFFILSVVITEKIAKLSPSPFVKWVCIVFFFTSFIMSIISFIAWIWVL